MQRKKIAVYFYAFMGGGAESVALWMLEALKKKYDLTLFTIANVDLESLNALYGKTQLSNSSIKVKYLLPGFLKSLAYFWIANNSDYRKIVIHLLLRYFKFHQSKYDLMISAYNAMDLGCRGIQYINWVNVIEGNDFHHKISNWREERLKTNISVANSHRVAKAVKKTYGVDCIVVYPPVVERIPQITWKEKENAFICSGRLTKVKQVHKVIQILSQVRQKGFDIQLYITAGAAGVYALEYRNFVNKMVSENSDWVTLFENLEYQDYLELLAKCKYGIHYKTEPFGIAIAEMVKAGAIPFVRSKGGQVEIVGEQNKELFFDNKSEAIEQIVTVLRDDKKQKKLLESLEERKSLFSPDKFGVKFSNIVALCFNKISGATTA